MEDIKGIEVEYWQTKDSPMRLTQVAPLLFQSVNGDERLSFRTSKDGQTTYLIDYNMRGDGAFKRISPLDRPLMKGSIRGKCHNPTVSKLPRLTLCALAPHRKRHGLPPPFKNCQFTKMLVGFPPPAALYQ